MKEWKLKGFVTPADCGNDLQKALDTAKALDICKVVIDTDLTADAPIEIPEGMYLILQNATLTAQLTVRGEENYSFCKKWITVEGENGVLQGDLRFFNASNVTVSGLKVQNLSCEYTGWLKLMDLSADTVTVGRGCTNVIAQKVTAQRLGICGDYSGGKIVPGSKPDVTNVVVQDCVGPVQITASPDCGVLNIQAQRISGSVEVGRPDLALPPEQFMNLSLIDIREGVQMHNSAKHAYIK